MKHKQRIWLVRAGAVLVLGAGLLALSTPSERAPRSPRPEPGVRGKSRPQLGTLSLTITSRPSADRAWVRGAWVRADDAHGCLVELLLPTGTHLVEGEPRVGAEAATGSHEWLVSFPTGADLDLVAQLCGTTSQGEQACEAIVRLAFSPR